MSAAAPFLRFLNVKPSVLRSFLTLNGVMRPVAVDICRKNPYNIVACATILRRSGKTVNRGGVLPRRREKSMAKFMKNINLISRSAELFREEKLGPYGIRGCQSKYLLTIAGSPGISQEELARRLFVNKSNVARQISLLEEAGFVRREGSVKDRRAVLLYPTDKLLDVMPRVRMVLAEWRALVTEGFTEEEKAELQRLSEKMVANARAYIGRGETRG